MPCANTGPDRISVRNKTGRWRLFTLILQAPRSGVERGDPGLEFDATLRARHDHVASLDTQATL